LIHPVLLCISALTVDMPTTSNDAARKVMKRPKTKAKSKAKCQPRPKQMIKTKCKPTVGEHSDGHGTPCSAASSTQPDPAQKTLECLPTVVRTPRPQHPTAAKSGSQPPQTPESGVKVQKQVKLFRFAKQLATPPRRIRGSIASPGARQHSPAAKSVGTPDSLSPTVPMEGDIQLMSPAPSHSAGQRESPLGPLAGDALSSAGAALGENVESCAPVAKVVTDGDMPSPSPRRLAAALSDPCMRAALGVAGPSDLPEDPGAPTHPIAGASIERSEHPQSPWRSPSLLVDDQPTSPPQPQPSPAPPARWQWRRPLERGSLWQGKRAVRDFGEALDWADHALDQLAIEHEVQCESEDGQMLQDLSDRFGNDTASCAFSGIDAPGVGINELSWALGRKLKDINGPATMATAVKPRMLHHTEWYWESQQELLRMPDCDSCVFGDIESFFKPELADLLEYLKTHPESTVPLLGPLVMTGLTVKTCGACLRHGGTCPANSAKVHFAGTPCPDWSSCGQHKGAGGRTMVHFVAWVALRRALQEPIVIQENVKGFPTDLMCEYLGDTYDITSVILDSESYGFPVARTRKWTLLLHKTKVLSCDTQFGDFMRRFQRATMFTWQHFFTASPEEVRDELVAAARRRTSRATLRGLKAEDLDPACPASFELALTEWEFDNMKSYREAHPNCMYSLYQSHAAGFGAFSTPKVMQTLIKNTGMYWGDRSSVKKPSRWLTSTECLGTQGFPVLRRAGDPITSSFQVGRARKSAVVAGQAGNAMCVTIPGLVYLYSTSCVRRMDQALISIARNVSYAWKILPAGHAVRMKRIYNTRTRGNEERENSERLEGERSQSQAQAEDALDVFGDSCPVPARVGNAK